MNQTLTYEEAVARLPEGERIHTFLANVGADWDRARVLEELRRAKEIRQAGPLGRALEHGIAVPYGRHWLLIGTRAEGSEEEAAERASLGQAQRGVYQRWRESGQSHRFALARARREADDAAIAAHAGALYDLLGRIWVALEGEVARTGKPLPHPLPALQREAEALVRAVRRGEGGK